MIRAVLLGLASVLLTACVTTAAAECVYEYGQWFCTGEGGSLPPEAEIEAL